MGQMEAATKSNRNETKKLGKENTRQSSKQTRKKNNNTIMKLEISAIHELE